MALSKHFGAEAALLVNMGLVRPEGHVSTVETWAGEFASVVWSPERFGYGYFSEDEGWVDLRPEEVGNFSLDVRKLAALLAEDLDLRPIGTFVDLVPGALWDVGFGRLPQLTMRVSIWIARSLHDPDVMEALREAARNRPTLDLRLILGLSDTEQPDWYIENQVLASVSSLVSVGNPLKIDATIASARLRRPVGKTEKAKLSADGGHLQVNGRDYVFGGPKQRIIVRQLHDAWELGSPRLLTENVLVEAECGRSVRRLANVFRGHPNWHEVIKEKAGFCWLEA